MLICSVRPRKTKYAGRRFGRLVVLGVARPRYLTVRCDCGVTKEVRSADVVSGNTQSCGCLKAELETSNPHSRKHGMRQTPTYKKWASMVDRTTNPGCTRWSYYGGRGIGLFEPWRKFENFFADMGVCPDGLTLERRDNSKGYFPDNCVWADKIAQANNRRNNRILTARGLSLSVGQWAIRAGVNESLIRNRLKRGWSVDNAIFKPQQTEGNKSRLRHMEEAEKTF